MIATGLQVPSKTAGNHEYIRITADYLRQLSPIGTNLCAYSLWNTIPAADQYLAEYTQKTAQSSEAILTFISMVKASDLHTALERACVEIMDRIQAIYSTELIPMIFNSVPEAAHLRERYELKQDYLAHQSLVGQSALKRNLSPIYCELGTISRLQEQLIATFPQFRAIIDNNPNSVENNALGFGAGILTVVHPLLGAPLLIHRWFSDNHKTEANKAMATDWWQRFNEFCDRWRNLYTDYQPVYEMQYQFIEEKLKNICEKVGPSILSDLDAAGFDLQRVPLTFQNFLADIKRQYGIE
jgi:hypothetical protein